MEFVAERIRQDKLKLEGRFDSTLADPEMTDAYRCMVLTEELGEIARAIQDEDEDNLREEIIQLGACCLAWLEGIDRDTGK